MSLTTDYNLVGVVKFLELDRQLEAVVWVSRDRQRLFLQTLRLQEPRHLMGGRGCVLFKCTGERLMSAIDETVTHNCKAAGWYQIFWQGAGSPYSTLSHRLCEREALGPQSLNTPWSRPNKVKNRIRTNFICENIICISFGPCCGGQRGGVMLAAVAKSHAIIQSATSFVSL